MYTTIIFGTIRITKADKWSNIREMIENIDKGRLYESNMLIFLKQSNNALNSNLDISSKEEICNFSLEFTILSYTLRTILRRTE